MGFGCIQRADQITAGLPKRAWQRISAGNGAKGHRYYERGHLEVLADQFFKGRGVASGQRPGSHG